MNQGWQSESFCLRSPLFLSFSLRFSLSLSDYLPTYLVNYLSTYLSVCLSTYLSICLSIYLSIHPSTYWADVVSYPRHPEITPSPWHTGLPQANRKLPQGPNPIGTLSPRHRWFGKQTCKMCPCHCELYI